MKKRTYILAIACVLLLLGLGRFYFTDSDFSPSNPFWNGMSELSFSLNVRPIYDMSGAGSMDAGDTLLIISPSRNFSASETAAVHSFLLGGGRVVVMDDFGHANSLLNGLGSPVTIDQVPLYQYDDFYRNQSCPIISVSPPYAKNVNRLVLNHPAALNVSGSALIIASSSRYGWLDINGDHTLSPNEKTMAYPVIASCPIGKGQLLVISDPDLFINSMLGKEDNMAFLSDIIQGRPWLDVSHGLQVVPLFRAYYALKFDPLLQSLTVLVIVVFVGLILWRRPLMGVIKRSRGK